MTRELESAENNKFEPQNGSENEYLANKKEWQRGEISNENFRKILIKRLLKTQHLFRKWDTKLSDLDPEEFDNNMRESPILTAAYDSGMKGEPIAERYETFFGDYFSTQPHRDAVRKRYFWQKNNPHYNLKISEFKYLDEELDEELLRSLPLHFFAANRNVKLYEKREENIAFSGYKNAVFGNITDTKEAATILNWLHYRGLRSATQRYANLALTRITDRNVEEKGVFVFDDYDKIAIALYPYMYFRGWQKRFEKNNAIREWSLPQPFDEKMEKESLLTAYFYYEDKWGMKTDLLGSALKSIGKTGKTDEIRERYARLQAKAINEGNNLPIKNWQVRELKLGPLMEKYLTVPLPVAEETPRTIEPEVESANDKSGVNVPVQDTLSDRKAVIEEEQKEPEADQEGDKNVEIPEEDHVENTIIAEGETKTEDKELYKAENSEPNKPKKDTTYRSKPRKSLQRLIKEELSRKTKWSSTDFYIYTNLLKVERKTALMKSGKYPDQLELSTSWNNLVNSFRSTSPFMVGSKVLFGVDSQDKILKFSELVPMHASGNESRQPTSPETDISTLQRFNPVIAEIFRDISPISPFESDPLFSISTLYNILKDKRELPITSITLNREKSYLIFRAANTLPLNSGLKDLSLEDFQNTWYEKSGLLTPSTRLGRFLSIEGISLLSPNHNRRPAIIAASKDRKVVMYESTDDLNYMRIA